MTQLTGQTDAVVRGVLHDTYAVPAASFWRDVVQLLKVRITVMVAIMAGIGFVAGMQTADVTSIPWLILTMTLTGVSLSCMGASVLNQVIERDTDALMNRTRNRPIAAGRVAIAPAMQLAIVLSVAGVGLLLVFAGWLPALLSALTIASYALVYTPMKRTTSLATIVGAAPGALPPAIGYTAITGLFDMRIGVMFAIMFLWQLPHFLAIAWLHREDYRRAGTRVLPVVDPTGASTFRQMLLCCMALLPLGLLPTMMGMAGTVYFFGALLAGAVFLGFAVALVIGRTSARARAMFYASLLYLPLVFALIVLDGK